MGTIASQITSLTVVYSIVYSGGDQRTHQFTGIGEFPAQRASNAENVSIWWRHHGDKMPSSGGTRIRTQPSMKPILQQTAYFGRLLVWFLLLFHSIFPVVHHTILKNIYPALLWLIAYHQFFVDSCNLLPILLRVAALGIHKNASDITLTHMDTIDPYWVVTNHI